MNAPRPAALFVAMVCCAVCASVPATRPTPTTQPTTRPIRSGALSGLSEEPFWTKEKPRIGVTGSGRVEGEPGFVESASLSNTLREVCVFVFDAPDHATAAMEERRTRVAAVIERGVSTDERPGPWWYCRTSQALLTIQCGSVLIEFRAEKHHFDAAEEAQCWAMVSRINAAIGNTAASGPATRPSAPKG